MSLTGKRVLDIGCGTGFFVDWYLKKGAAVCGIDITEVSIARLKQKYQGEFYTEDITAPNFTLLGREFDIINMWDVIYHIVDPGRFQQAFDNIAGSMKDGALLLYTDRFGAPSDVRLAEHVQMRCLHTYAQILPKMGFELKGIYPLYNHLNRAHLKLGKLNLPVIDNYLGWLYYRLDNRLNTIPADNLSLAVWRYCQ
jgi:SAM-dependent methyltransferase